MSDLSNYRRSYEKSELTEDNLPEDPVNLFKKWFIEVEEFDGPGEVNAMTVSTLGLDGFPKSRVVLLKQYTYEGFIFFTNYDSEKGRAIAANPNICLSFFWEGMERQVIIKGRAEKVSENISDGYFESRPVGSRLGAVVSPQSQVIPSRDYLEQNLNALEKEYKDIADESLLVKIKKIREPKLLKDKALYYYLLAAGYQSSDKYVDAYNYYLKAKKAYLGIDSLDRAMDINDDIYSMISAQDNPTDAYKKYLDEFIAYAKKTKDPLKLARMYAILGNEAYTENKPKESLENFKKALALFKDKKKDKKITRLYSNIATIYNERLHLHDSALYYLNIQLPEIKDHGTLMDLCYNYVNQAASYHYMGEYDKAIDYLKMADNLPLKDHKTKINQF